MFQINHKGCSQCPEERVIDVQQETGIANTNPNKIIGVNLKSRISNITFADPFQIVIYTLAKEKLSGYNRESSSSTSL